LLIILHKRREEKQERERERERERDVMLRAQAGRDFPAWK